ncbi:MAG: hypothetical protein J7L88_01130 [Thermoplasmata archaeon]|nr:hypothetical protein [Thermoplasmata archaeon]
MAFPYCVLCKGSKNLCGIHPCPLLTEIKRRMPPLEIKNEEIFGPSPPEVFVGRYNYPNISIGPMIPPVEEETSRYILGEELWGRSIEEVYALRSSLIRGKRGVNARSPGVDFLKLSSHPIIEEERLKGGERRVLESLQELSLSVKSVDCEMRLDKKPSQAIRPTVRRIEMPFGPTLSFQRFRVVENPSTLPALERAVYDYDLKAEEAAWELYRSGVPLEKVIQLLSIGNLGTGRRRRLVPTRWSITATDDIIFRRMKEEISTYPSVDSLMLFQENYAGNYIQVILQPGPLQFEMLEQWQKGAFWGESRTILHDYEGPRGRKDYAKTVEGAYYAARLAVGEYLLKVRRSATITVIRRITSEYWAPLGVWVIRETTRRALKKKPLIFDSREALIRHVEMTSKIPGVVEKSIFLKGMLQMTLF